MTSCEDVLLLSGFAGLTGLPALPAVLLLRADTRGLLGLALSAAGFSVLCRVIG